MRFFTIVYLLCFSVLANENSLEFKLIFKKENVNKNIKAIDNFNNIYSIENNELIEKETEELFDQDINEEEDFEIPAFLRKQKF